MFSHPDNADTKRKKADNELDVYLSTPKEWRKSEKKRLYDAVRESALNNRLRSLNQEKELVLTRRNNRYLDEKDRENLNRRLKELKDTELKIRSQTDSELFANLAEEFSWLEISMQTFDGYFSEKSCRLMWRNVLHPSINRGHWTKKEDQLLKQLAKHRMSENQGFVNWDDIAAEIGNGRIAFHTFMRFQQKHNTFLDRRKWTYEQDERLKKLVAHCRINKHFVPWPKVAYYMTNRTKDQCYQRYIYSLQSHLRKGVFTESEDFVIIIGVKLFGHNWAKISEFLPNRTPIQIHSRFNTFLNANFQSWSQKEDLHLLQLVKEKGYRVWAEISKNFETRTRSQCRNRFHIIYKMFQLQPNNFDLTKMKYRSNSETTLQGRRQKLLYDNLEKKVNLFLEQRRNICAKRKQKKKKRPHTKNRKTPKRNKNMSIKAQNDIVSQPGSNQTLDSDINIVKFTDTLDLQMSEDDTDSDFLSEGEEFASDLENDSFNLTNKLLDDETVSSSNDIADSQALKEYKSSTEKNTNIKYYHTTTEAMKIPNKYLLEFLSSLQCELPLKSDSWDGGGYESISYQRVAIDKNAGSALTKRYRNPMPIKHMSAFVSTNKKGVPVTTYKGNTGRQGPVQNTACKQALTDRSLSIYFRPSWPGRVGKPVGTYKMVKSQQDQLRQALGAANFYGQLLQIYPSDLKHRVKAMPLSSSSDESIEFMHSILRLYISEQNENLFYHISSQNSPVSYRTKSDTTTNTPKSSFQQISERPFTTNSPFPSQGDINQRSKTNDKPIRTYSRKKKNISSSCTNSQIDRTSVLESYEGASMHKVYRVEKRNVSKSCVKKQFIRFMPSNNQTLVGLRGLLLQLRTLKTLVYPEGTGVRISLDRIVQEGVHHIDLFSDQREVENSFKGESNMKQKSSQEKSTANHIPTSRTWSGGGEVEVWGQRKLTPQEADELLVDRFLSIYFWPAQMSALRPPPRESIFESSKLPEQGVEYAGPVEGFNGSYPGHPTGPYYGSKYGVPVEGRESMAAAEPFDASKLIEAAKIRAATTPQRRIIVVPRNVNDGIGLAVPKQEPGIDVLEPTVDSTQLVSECLNRNDADVTMSSNTEIDRNITTKNAFAQETPNTYLNTRFISDNADSQVKKMPQVEGMAFNKR